MSAVRGVVEPHALAPVRVSHPTFGLTLTTSLHATCCCLRGPGADPTLPPIHARSGSSRREERAVRREDPTVHRLTCPGRRNRSQNKETTTASHKPQRKRSHLHADRGSCSTLIVPPPEWRDPRARCRAAWPRPNTMIHARATAKIDVRRPGLVRSPWVSTMWCGTLASRGSRSVRSDDLSCCSPEIDGRQPKAIRGRVLRLAILKIAMPFCRG